MEGLNFQAILMIVLFVIGYFFITIEHYTKVNKATVALMMAIACWAVQFLTPEAEWKVNMEHLAVHLAEVSQVVFFLLGALAVVEIINAHRGFEVISDYVRFRSKKQLLWAICIITFFLSSILDNLTTTIVMLSLVRKLVDESDRNDRLLIGGGIVIAANAGGAWTPIGDVTTTMLWIGGELSTFQVMKELIIPSLVCLVVSILLLSPFLKGVFGKNEIHFSKRHPEPMGNFVFFLGIALLVFVPIFKALTGLPPFMGMLFALSLLWMITDFAHRHYDDREHLRVPHILTKIDISGLLFFLGILLCINALYTAGLLDRLALWLDANIGHVNVIAALIGIISAVIDNVPLVAASMGMYGLERFAVDSQFWMLVAYCAGTGGSILIIGSAAGVVFMGLEKADFFWYLRRISIPALAGYLAGFFAYLLLK